MKPPEPHRLATESEQAHINRRLRREGTVLWVGAAFSGLCTLAAVGGSVAIFLGQSWLHGVVLGLVSLLAGGATWLVWSSATSARARLREFQDKPQLHRVRGEWRPAGKRSPPTLAGLPAFLPNRWARQLQEGRSYKIEGRLLVDPDLVLEDYSATTLLVVSVKGQGVSLRMD